MVTQHSRSDAKEPTLPSDGTSQLLEETKAVNRDERRLRRLDAPMSVLGVIFLLVVLGQSLAADARLQQVLSVLVGELSSAKPT